MIARDITVLIADDHPIFLRGLVALIESTPDYKLVSKNDNGREAFESIKVSKPDMAVLDISMPEMSGLDIVEEIGKENLKIEFIILTMYKDEDYFNKAIDLGVKGYILKENAEDELLDSLKAVANGKHYVSHALSGYLIKKNKEIKSFFEEFPQIKNLTPAEKHVLKLISENKTSKDIAKKLFISYKTVDNHRSNISAKLGLRGRNQLLLFALENKSVL